MYSKRNTAVFIILLPIYNREWLLNNGTISFECAPG